jgi:hypothetical protein
MSLDSVIATVSDKEKISFLVERHEKILKWLRWQIEVERKMLLPEPHPLDFSLHTHEEEMEERHRIEVQNTMHQSYIGAYEITLEAIENGTRSMEKKFHPCNEFEI